LQENFWDVAEIKQAIRDDDLMTAAGLLADMSEEVMTALWVAPTKGGIWTTAERDLMKGDIAKIVSTIKKKEVA
jgi:hypothetical protein